MPNIRFQTGTEPLEVLIMIVNHNYRPVQRKESNISLF